MLHAIAILLLISLKETSQLKAQFLPPTIERSSEGDRFSVPNLKDCNEFNAVYNETLLFGRDGYVWCKCRVEESTVFLKKDGPLCLTDSGKIDFDN